ncbi:methyl-accepting chemotaxis protein [Terrisporobacter petrolearius]|uniref:methyl-accepting chemotaxis protein n=1 Tax=Terrisporobacter petrolearius TaxID=1460447 RepID=UPI0022E6B785|nr:methyl-accepting chemotaxis protein [Terrisporobacter petrolearius]
MNRRFTNLKIGKKMVLGFGMLLIAFAIIGTLSLRNLRVVGGHTVDLFEGPYQLTNEAMAIRRGITSVDQNIAYALVQKDISNFEAPINEYFNDLYERIEKIKNNPEADIDLAKKLEASVGNFKQEYEKIKGVINNGNTKTINKLIVDEKSDYFLAYMDVAENAGTLYDNEIEKGILFKENVTKKVRKVWAICVVMSTCTIIGAIVIGIYITRKIRQPIEELEIAANKMSLGDFDIEIDYESEDELGSLSNSMISMSNTIKAMIGDVVNVLQEIASGNFDVEPKVEYIGVFNSIEKSLEHITNELSDTMSQINVASDQVQSASDQVASGAQMLSQGTTEQAGSIEELSATIAEISNQVKETAKNAQEANVLYTDAGREVKDGNEKMKNMIVAMDEISSTSNEIGRIIKTIDDIAFQTNILALNAAVEAARAGEAGKGFAVVADEVRNLAEKSAEAAKNTSTLIENSINAVENGTSIVDNTSQSLQRILDKTNKVVSLLDRIAKGSEEESDAINQVTLGLEQISAVVQTNSATSEESAAASEELSGQAQILKSLIDDFNLKNKSDDTVLDFNI